MAENVIVIDANPNPKSDKFNTRWWNEDKENIFSHLFRTVEMLEQKQSYRTQENIKHARLYSDLEVLGVYAGLYSPSVKESTLPNRLSLNVVKSCIDTVTSKIAKSKPRPMFLTEGGNWTQKQKAQSLTKYIDGLFDQMNHYETKQDTFRDEGIFGTGLAKFFIDNQRKEIKSERTIVEELLVDDADALYGTPQVLYQRRLVNKDVLAEDFPFYRDEIKDASHGLDGGAATSPYIKDLVRVIEAWKLPSGPEAGDGLHVVCISNQTLFVEKWEFDWFPFSKEVWNKPLLGFFGVGIAKELTPIQIEINKILRNIQQAMHLVAVPRTFVSNDSNVNLHAITNDIGAIIKYSGVNPPQFYSPQAMSADVYNHLYWLYQKAFEIVGVSQLSASSAKPQGLDSGKALREFQDIESDRFQIVGQRREASFLRDAKICLELSKKLAKKDSKFSVKVANEGSMKTIKFSEVNMKDEQFILRVFPTSILPTQPAAKMQTVIEYTQAGFFDKETAMDLLDMPDLESAMGMQLAPRRLVLKQLNRIVESNEYEPPEPYMNLTLTKSIAQNFYMYSKNQGVPEETLELIRTYIDQVLSLEQVAMAGVQQQMAATAPAMPASPEALPTNEMLPQTPV